ncbi:hypothetical protein SVIO_091760 [Streptomyces violaceusniger]|uniref:Uncharacterized protein n=1 Tax=Streptomyces violaceusniger TaxID=68280 RepID=A0A4D4LKF5_STRVO|nr:hypothetical protein SVIO_091760 [Streptomyces violaceusniger]
MRPYLYAQQMPGLGPEAEAARGASLAADRALLGGHLDHQTAVGQPVDHPLDGGPGQPGHPGQIGEARAPGAAARLVPATPAAAPDAVAARSACRTTAELMRRSRDGSPPVSRPNVGLPPSAYLPDRIRWARTRRVPPPSSDRPAVARPI